MLTLPLHITNSRNFNGENSTTCLRLCRSVCAQDPMCNICRTLVNWWRAGSTEAVMYLDDGAGAAESEVL